MDWVNVITVIGGTAVTLVPVTVVIKNTLDIIEKAQTMNEKRKAKKEQKEPKQNKRPVVRRNLARSKRITRR
ncbi:hypothetical protein P4T48_26595 [Bacillus paramycoides]|uniref:hypothetical protein n=1 Tax=Bacillus paramycoides TaxID=2026194 RepID=UPI002E21C888|nr:hypothetical protein [Bacillus paramycoides]